MPVSSPTGSVLAVLPVAEDQACLKQILERSDWKLHVVDAMNQALTLIDQLNAGVVISDSKLPDGNWHDMLAELRRKRHEPVLIVASRLADDRLWAEVLNLGGYDVLATPLRPPEVIRSVSLAWQTWQHRFMTGDRNPEKVMVAGSHGGLHSEWPG